MAGVMIEQLEDRQLFSYAAILTMLISHPTLDGDFHTEVSDHQKVSEPAQFVLDYLKNTNPTTSSATVRPANKGQVVSTTFRLIIEEPTVLFSPFPTVYTFTLNSKHPLNLFSIKHKDSQGDTMVFTGTFTLKTGTISGALKITGPNRAESATYSVSPVKTKK
jgi:hypothetical protein